jgi:hypothetical protein
VTVTGTPNFLIVFAVCTNASIVTKTLSFSGSATGQRYIAQKGGCIETFGGGANFFPGNVAGNSSTGYYS